jgi:hypothetical protein
MHIPIWLKTFWFISLSLKVWYRKTEITIKMPDVIMYALYDL